MAGKLILGRMDIFKRRKVNRSGSLSSTTEGITTSRRITGQKSSRKSPISLGRDLRHLRKGENDGPAIAKAKVLQFS